MFHRKPSTPWSEKEIRRFKTLMIAVGDLELIERYYVYQRKRENGIHRRDLYTFLNNFSGELDRARAWDEEMRERLKRKVRRHLDPEDNVKQTNGADWKRIADLAKAEMERFKNQFA
jgi:hypothetical protein